MNAQKNNSKQDDFFQNIGEHIIKFRWLYIIVLLLITIITGAGLEKIEFDNSVEKWFPKHSEIFANKYEFEANFGNSDIIGIHLKADNVFTKEIILMLDTLVEELETKVPFADDAKSIANMEYSYAKGDEIITEDLIPDNPTKEDIELGKRRVLNKPYLKNVMVSEDCTETWLILNLLAYPENYEETHDGIVPENEVGKSILEILNQNKYKDYNLRSVGMPVFGYEELLFTGKESTRLLSVTMIVLIVFLILFFRSFKGIIIPLLACMVSIIIVFGIMGYLGIKINGFLFSVPIILSLAVSLGYSVHLFNYYQRGLSGNLPVKESVAMAIGKAGKPTLFAGLTTIAALLSFMAINLIPIQWLGATSACLIMVILIVVFVLTGALLSFGKTKNKDKVNAGFKSDKYFSKLGTFVFKYPKSITAVSGVIIVLMVVGLTSIEVNFDSKRSYGMKVPYMKRMFDIAKTQIGTFDSYNITLDFKEADKVKEPNVLDKFDEYIQQVNKMGLTKKTHSILPVIKDMNCLINENSSQYYKIPNNKNLIAQLLMVYEMSGGDELYKWVNDDFSIIRLEVGTNDMNSRQTLKEMKKLKSMASELFPGAEFNITGGMPKLAALNHSISVGQIKSLALALLIIVILMMLVFKSVKIGLIGLIPNLMPVLIVGGTMGLCNIPIDFITVTIVPIILGVAVDDTIHFINHLKKDYMQTGNYLFSSQNTIIDIGRALFMTSFLLIISFVIYLTSPVNMFVYLGLFIVLGIFTAFVSDIFITPIVIKFLKPFSVDHNYTI